MRVWTKAAVVAGVMLVIIATYLAIRPATIAEWGMWAMLVALVAATVVVYVLWRMKAGPFEDKGEEDIDE